MTAKAKRIRRTPEEARRVILAVARTRLASTGPEGLRLQDIASDAGISHPTILHHFGSREGLVRALTRETVLELKDKMLTGLATDSSTEAMLNQVFDIFRDGLAQRLAWLATVDPDGHQANRSNTLRDITDTLHARRLAAGLVVARQDTEALVHLVAIAAFGDAMYGDHLRREAGQDDAPAGEAYFRRWLAALVRAHERAAAPPRE